MAGKRYDQHNIAPAEAGSTDYKRYPETTHGQNDDLSTQGDKQRLVQSRQDAQGQPFLPDVPAPSVHAQQGRQARAQEDESEEGAADPDSGKENPRI